MLTSTIKSSAENTVPNTIEHPDNIVTKCAVPFFVVCATATQRTALAVVVNKNHMRSNKHLTTC